MTYKIIILRKWYSNPRVKNSWLQTLSFSTLTIAEANNVNVNSGPNDIINLKINDKTRHLIDNCVGIVMTTAAEISNNAQSNPER